MATNFFPALDVQPLQQTDVMGQLGKVVALRNALQTQQYEQQIRPLQLQAQQQQLQTGALDLQMKQLQLKSDQTLMEGMTEEFGGGGQAAPTSGGQGTAASAPAGGGQAAQAAAPAPTTSDQTQQPGGGQEPSGGQVAAPTTPAAPTTAAPTTTTVAQQPAGDFLTRMQRGLSKAMQTGNVLPQTVLEFNGKILQQQNTYATMSKSAQETAQAQNKAAGELAARFTNADPAQQPALWAQAQQAIRNNPNAASLYGPDLVNYIANNPYPGQQAIQQHMGALQGEEAMLNDQQKALDVKEKEQKIAPFSDALRTQYNAGIDANFMKWTGKPAPDYFHLQPGQGQIQLDNINAMGKATIDAIKESPQFRGKVSAAEAWAKVGAEVATEVRKQQALASPIDQLTRTTISGKQYIDASDLSPQAGAYERQQAAAKGVPVVDKETADVLREIDTAKANQQFMLSAIQSKLASDPTQRLYTGPKNTLEKLSQSDPNLAAVGTFSAAAIQSLRAAAGSKGLRMSQFEVQNAIKNFVPQMTDTLPAAQKKLQDFNNFLDNAENSHIMPNRSTMLQQPSAGGGAGGAPSVNTPPPGAKVRDYTQVR